MAVDDDVAAHRTVAQCLVASIGNSIQAIAWYAGEDVDQLPIPVGIMLQPLPGTMNGSGQIPVLERCAVA